MKALILAPFWAPALDRLRTQVEVFFESWMDTRRLLAPEELADRLRKQAIEIVVVEADFVFAEVFENAPGLRLLGVCRGSVTNVDLESATEHGVLVVNTPGRNAVSVAELTVGLMLSLARQILEADRYIKSGAWTDPVGPYFSLRGQELAGKVAGIVGLGAVGYEVARRLRAFEMSLLVYDPYVNRTKLRQVGGQAVSLEELMERSDFITLHCPLVPETIGMISAARIRFMKPTAYFVNTADAGLVDEEALCEALQQGRLAGAAFDVFQSHPLSPDSPLLKTGRVLLTPHIGGATSDVIRRHSQMVLEDIERFLKRERPLHLVNPGAWERRVA